MTYFLVNFSFLKEVNVFKFRKFLSLVKVHKSY